MSPTEFWPGATILAGAEDELVGKTLNKTYSVERFLGEGAMGRVYQARHPRIPQKLVAVKVLRPEYLRNAEVLARFQREAETAASISHPNVVAVYDVDRTAQGLPYLVSEYLVGLDLGQYIKQKKKLSLATAVHIARQLCEGLRAAHRCGVIHRDLKPSNIFLVGDFDVAVPQLPFIKILDFGLSKFVDAPSGQLVTETGIVMGTPAFMPPEQAQGQKADLRADIYGVGALLYICLTGRLPFDEATPQATVLAVIGSEPLRPRALDPSIPEYAELVIQRAMAKQPEARYPDMAALLEALEPLVDNQHGRQEINASRLTPWTSFETPVERARTARPRLLLWLCLALVLLIGSAAVTVAAIAQLAGWSVTRRELGLALICGVAVASTPTALIIAKIRRLVWGNTNRVHQLLTGVRGAVLMAAATYGLAWLGSRVLDAVVLKLMREPIRANFAWPGWDLLLPMVGVGAGAVALLRHRAPSETLSGWRREIVGGLAVVATLAVAAFVIPLGLHWRTQESRATPARATTAPSTAYLVAPKQTAAPESLASSAISATIAPSASPSAALPPDELASREELHAARGRGVDGWSPLADRYPSDARVLRALVLAHASRATGLGNAMTVARRLFQVDPNEANRGDMQYLVQRAAETSGPPAELAWKMLAEAMGTHGPDVVYRLSLTKPKLGERAKQLLGDAAVRPRISPALAIAYELRQASSCLARLPLLDRAVEVGDERAIAVLAGLSTGTTRGCGKNKRKACAPACPEQAEAFRAAIAKLSKRLRAGSE
jgi:tRNA A-37 threonylcarbamoyl transferase component Bud32